MLPAYEEFAENARQVRDRIDEACHAARRDPATVHLQAVTKNHPAAAAEYAARFGLESVGENRVQEGAAKRPQCQAAIRWDLIGHLQSNKARLAVATFDRVQSLDSLKLTTHLDRAAGEHGKRLPVLLQVNTGNDPAKFGIDPSEAPRLLDAALGAPNLTVEGLMTIAPLSDDPAVAERTFVGLRDLRDRLAAQFKVSLPELSMGMTSDFPIAIAAGSTLVRIGTALFGERPTQPT